MRSILEVLALNNYNSFIVKSGKKSVSCELDLRRGFQTKIRNSRYIIGDEEIRFRSEL